MSIDVDRVFDSVGRSLGSTDVRIRRRTSSPGIIDVSYKNVEFFLVFRSAFPHLQVTSNDDGLEFAYDRKLFPGNPIRSIEKIDMCMSASVTAFDRRKQVVFARLVRNALFRFSSSFHFHIHIHTYTLKT